MKYRKKPVEVEAEQFWPDQPLPFAGLGPFVAFDGTRFYVVTAHDQRVNLEAGDWVIPETPISHGFRACGYRAYPVKPDIFEQTYEPVETPTEGTP